MALSACQKSNISSTVQPSTQRSPTPTGVSTQEISIPPATVTSTLIAVASPSVTTLPTFTPSTTPPSTMTPELGIDWSLFDPDIKPPIEIFHSEPLIVKSDTFRLQRPGGFTVRSGWAACDSGPGRRTNRTTHGERAPFVSHGSRWECRSNCPGVRDFPHSLDQRFKSIGFF
jgi:hypothetical protein